VPVTVGAWRTDGGIASTFALRRDAAAALPATLVAVATTRSVWSTSVAVAM
jgi:hypothetical protein